MDVEKKIVSQGRLAFLAWKKYQKKNQLKNQKKALFPEEDQGVYILVKYKKVALSHGPVMRRFVELPHSDRSPSNTTICLILPDFDRSDKAKKDPDVDKQAREWAVIIKEKYGLGGEDITKILTYDQMSREYSQAAEKRDLSNAYDIFLVDSMLQKKVFSFLGGNFQKANKMPFPINANGGKLDEEISRAYQLVNLPLRALKDSVTVRIGNLTQKTSHLVFNLEAIVEKMFEHCPGGVNNFRACYIQDRKKFLSFPIYADLGSANDVDLPEFRKRKYEEVFDECSTLPEGLAVKVTADGIVTVVDEKTMEEVIYPGMNDEFEAGDDLKPSEKEIAWLIKQKAKEEIKEEEEEKAEPVQEVEKKKKKKSLKA